MDWLSLWEWLIPLLVNVLAFVAIEAATLFLLMWFVVRDKEAWSRPQRWGGWLLVSLIAASVVWSIWFESLWPYVRKGRYKQFALTAVGILGMLLGTGLVLYGGVISLRNTFQLHEDKEFLQMLSPVDARHSPATAGGSRWQNLLKTLGRLWRAWAPGAGWILIGLGLMIGPAGYLSDLDLGLDVARLVTGLGMMVLGGLFCLIYR